MCGARETIQRVGRSVGRGLRRRRAWRARLLFTGIISFCGLGVDTAWGEQHALTLTMHEGLISGEIIGVPLSEVLQRLTQITGIPVWWRGERDVECGPHRFADVPPSEAIRRILAKQDFLLARGPMDDGAWRLQLWITSSDGSDAPAIRIDGRPRVASENGSARWATLLAAVPPAVELLASAAVRSAAAEDRVASVRALEQVAAEDSRVALLVREIAQSDADADVRQAAMDVLGTAAPN